MNKKIILIIIGATIISITSVYFTIDYMFNEQWNEKSHNNRFVKNCVPSGSDKIVPSIGIENKTHQFDLRNCIWIKNSEFLNEPIIQKASEYDSRIFFENAFTEEQICYGKNDDGSKIPLECDVPLHGNSPFNFDDDLQNDPAVKDCVPKVPGEAWTTQPYRNSTHTFDIEFCTWNLK